jgi:hypothetical protein
MDWTGENVARLYAAIHGKIGRIREDCGHIPGSRGFFAQHDRYRDFLQGLGISGVRLDGEGPRWTNPDGTPVDEQADVVIPDPFFALDDSPDPGGNPEKGRGIRVPKETAVRILAIGTP